MVCPGAAAAAVQIIQSAVGGTGSGRKPRNRIHTLCGPWKRNVEGKQQGGKHFGVRMNDEVRRVGEAEGVAAPPRQKQKASLLPLDDKCLEATHSPPVSSSHLSLTGYIPTHSPTSPTSTSTLRAARAHDADLQICSL